MTPQTIIGKTAGDVCFKALAHFLSSSNVEHSSPRSMSITETRGVVYQLTDPRRCAAYLPGRSLNYHFMLAEWLWIALGRDDVEFISHYCKEISRFSDDGKTFFGAYGPRWRGQVDYVLEKLQNDPDSRQAVINIWRENPPATNDVPCTLSMQYFIRNDRVEAFVNMRSSDVWLGLPYDLHNFSQLQKHVAFELGREAGPLTLYVASAHLYDRDRDKALGVFNETSELTANELDDLQISLPAVAIPGGVVETTELAARTRGAWPQDEWLPADWLGYLRALATRSQPDKICELPTWIGELFY